MPVHSEEKSIVQQCASAFSLMHFLIEQEPIFMVKSIMKKKKSPFLNPALKNAMNSKGSFSTTTAVVKSDEKMGHHR